MSSNNVNKIKERLTKKLERNLDNQLNKINSIKEAIDYIKGCANERELIGLMTGECKCPSIYDISDCKETEDGRCALTCWECWEQAISNMK